MAEETDATDDLEVVEAGQSAFSATGPVDPSAASADDADDADRHHDDGAEHEGSGDDHDGRCKHGDHEGRGHGKHAKHGRRAREFPPPGMPSTARAIAPSHRAPAAGQPARLLERLHAIDANQDGLVTRDEAKAAAGR